MTLYEKRGRRYHPVRESLGWDTYPEGAYIVVVRPGQRSLCRLAEPDHPGFEAAAKVALDAMTRAIMEASDARPRAAKLTARERRAYEAWRAIMGEETFWLQRNSAHDIAEAGIAAVREEYRRRRAKEEPDRDV